MAIIKIPNSDGSQADYQNDPTIVTTALGDICNLVDFHAAKPGQWFYGVVHSMTGKVYVVAGDVHDDPGNATQQNPRMRNTYASKPAVPAMGWTSLSGEEKKNGIKSTPTGHQAVARLYRLDGGSCLGFRLIKINSSFATFSDRSNSMNGNKPDQHSVVKHAFGTDPATLPNVANVSHVIAGPGGFSASSTARMAPVWATAIQTFLKSKLGITNLAVDF